MKYIKTGLVLLALSVFPAQALAQTAHSHRPCAKTFTVWMAQRAAHAVYAGTRHVTLAERQMLGRIQRCQKNPGARGYVRWYEQHRRTLWLERLNPPRPAVTASAPNALVQCIVQRESGGNSQAVNPSGHMGLGQWDEPTWLGDGGGRYAHTPLGASYGEQLTIIEEQVAEGHTSQWTAYDGC